tara:strand:- start:552 stop:737 length:186 start_codon:yes stop_codon:yes gene_type:complete
MTIEFETPLEFMMSQTFGIEMTEAQMLAQVPQARRPVPTKPIKSRRKGENEKKHIRRDGKK